MKVILLAAGIGSRLRPLTQNVPKSLLNISDNETAIERTIKMINKTIDCDIVIVTGFKKEKFSNVINRFSNCINISNPFYEVTNSIASLWFARDYLDDDVIIINGDVILEERLFKKIVSTHEDASVFYDSSIGENADYKVAEVDGKVVVMSKELREFSGEYIGVSKFSRNVSNKVRTKIDEMIDVGSINEWYETALVDMIFNNGLTLLGIDVADYEWTEIDNVNDLIKAKRIIKNEQKLIKD